MSKVVRLRADVALKVGVAIYGFAICVAIVALFFVMAGCTTVPVPHDVDVAVKTDCHPAKIDKPGFAADTIAQSDDIYEQAKKLLADRTQRQDYEKLLEAANSACQ